MIYEDGKLFKVINMQHNKFIEPVCHPDDEDVVELVHTVDLGQQLVHNRVVHTFKYIYIYTTIYWCVYI